ncbi:AMP-binding protein [Nonomuraea lactucae]|uniref:AMP-binding protein n=1 Tax=Nonomuraea lactucae TaxID=2249762 RepID=UPI000DE24DE9|nr:AMP-binding protein [Nonomuraea lactucae]
MTWTDLVIGKATVWGDRPAVSDVRTGEVLSYATFARRVTHAAAGLRGHGLRYGDRVLVDLPLGARFAVAVHSVAWSGGVVVLGSAGSARMLITDRCHDPAAVDVEHVFTMQPVRGATPFRALMGPRTVEFGPLAGPALSVDGSRVLDNDELAADLRKLTADLMIDEDDVLLAAVSDAVKGLRVIDLAMMAGASAVVVLGPTLTTCRVLAHEYGATLVVAPFDLARRLAGDRTLRVVDERAIVESLGL